ncbi:MAG: hypothetical protein WCV81_00370 [Microgenomates group bacterium]|jgi:hypothetical protein
MSKNEKEITLCGKCKDWEFDRFTSGRMGQPYGACKLSRTENGHPIQQSLSIACSNVTEGIKTWQKTSEEYGCVQGTDSGKNINWSKFAKFTIPTLEEVITNLSQK